MSDQVDSWHSGYHCKVKRFNRGLEVGTCGEPAIAVWHWAEKALYVCEEHDEQINAEDRWGRRTDLRAHRPQEGTDGE